MRQVIAGTRFDLSIDYDDFSAPWRNDKTAIVLQHGFGRTSDIWTTWVPHLACEFPVVRPTLRGQFQRPSDFASADISMENYIDDLIAILDHLGVGSVHFCGESFGGCIGVAFAAQHPERIKTLSLVATPVMQSDRWRQTYSMGHGSWSRALEVLGIDAWLEETNRLSRFPPTVSSKLVDWYNAQVRCADPEVLIAMARLIEQADIRELLPSVQAPVLLMSPIGGKIMTDDQIDAYRSNVADFSFLGFETSFHKIQLLHAEECARHVKYFCGQADQRALLGS